MARLFTYLLLGSFLPFWLTAQPKNFNFQVYTSKDGLSSNSIRSALQDDLGFLWIGTDKGIERFDGNEFVAFEDIYGDSILLNDFSIEALYQDRLGWIWAGAFENGLIGFHPKTRKVKHFKNNPTKPNSYKGLSPRCFFEDNQGRLWISVSREGLNIYHPETETFQFLKPFTDETLLKKHANFQLVLHDPIHDEQDSSIVWLAAARGICKLNTDSLTAQYFELRKKNSAHPEGSEMPFIRNMIRDNEGIFWGTSWGHGLFRFDTRSETHEIYDCASEESVRNCMNARGILQVKDNHLILDSPASGWILFNKNSGQFKHWSDSPVASKVPYGKGATFYQDKQENIWAIPYYNNTGLVSIQPQQQLFQKVVLNGNVQKVLAHPSKPILYAITYGGTFYTFNESTQKLSKFRAHNPIFPEEYGFYDMEFDSTGKLWISGFYDLYYWDEDKQQVKGLKWKSWAENRARFGYYWNIVIDQNQHLWISAQSGGMGQLDLNNRTFHLNDFEEGNPNSLIYNYSLGSLYVDDFNNVWGSGDGIFYYSNEKKHFVNYPSPAKAADGGTPFTKYAKFLMDSKKQMWAAFTLDRVARIDLLQPLDTPFRVYEPTKNLPAAKVEWMIEDLEGNIWLSSSKGLTKIYPDSDKVEHFGASYGLKNLGRMTMAEDGEIFVAIYNGFYRFYPKDISYQNFAPKPTITNFKIFDKPYSKNINPAYLKEVQLSYKENFFSFDFSAMDFANKNPKQYSYILEGVDKDWIDAGTRKYVGYTNIGGGKYRFRLRAKNEGGTWSEEEAQLKISISPPFWETWWFWTLTIITILAVINLIHKTKIKQIRREENLKTEFNKQLAEVEMKALRAQMNPHFLFNSLNAIKFYVLKRSKEKAADYLTDFSKLIRLVLQNSSQQLIPLADELEALNLYITIEQLRFDEQFDFEIILDDQIEPEHFLIPPLLFQPYAENAIWHGLMHKKDGKGKLSIRLTKLNKGLQCIIEDNGIGRAKAKEVKSKSAQKQKSMGMNITRHRMDMSSYLTNMTFEVNIEDLKSGSGEALGTRVLINIIML